jgi:hypothetical protein
MAVANTSARSRRPPVVQYPIKVDFGVGIDVRWSRDTGTRNGACNSWTHEEGTFEADGGTIGEIPQGAKVVGQFMHPLAGMVSTSRLWALVNAVGQARVHTKRTLRQEGQTNACPPSGAVATKFPPNDCGERSYVSRAASIRADRRKSLLDLENALMSPPSNLAIYDVLALDLPPQQMLYTACSAPLAALETLSNVGLIVSPDDLRKLRRLRVGQRLRIEDTFHGGIPCWKPARVGETCTAKIDLHADIRRVKPPSGR